MPMTDEKTRKNDLAPYYFHQGASEKAYEYLGAHRTGETVTFRVWAPNADSVSVVGISAVGMLPAIRWSA